MNFVDQCTRKLGQGGGECNWLALVVVVDWSKCLVLWLVAMNGESREDQPFWAEAWDPFASTSALQHARQVDTVVDRANDIQPLRVPKLFGCFPCYCKEVLPWSRSRAATQ